METIPKCSENALCKNTWSPSRQKDLTVYANDWYLDPFASQLVAWTSQIGRNVKPPMTTSRVLLKLFSYSLRCWEAIFRTLYPGLGKGVIWWDRRMSRRDVLGNDLVSGDMGGGGI